MRKERDSAGTMGSPNEGAMRIIKRKERIIKTTKSEKRNDDRPLGSSKCAGDGGRSAEHPRQTSSWKPLFPLYLPNQL